LPNFFISLFCHWLLQLDGSPTWTVKLCDAQASNAAAATSSTIHDAAATSSAAHDAAATPTHISEVAATATPFEEDQLTGSHDPEDTTAVNESAATKGKYHKTWGKDQPATTLPNQHAAAYLVVMNATKGNQDRQYGNQQTNSLSRQSTLYGKQYTPANHGLSCSLRLIQAEWGHHRRKDLEETIGA
jgi:hypothetical protein